MKVIDEFKTFALKGNMVDLAIGVIIGTSFNRVVNSIVTDLVNPVLGFLIGGVDFSKLNVSLHFPGSEKPPVLWNVGSFCSALLDFFIVAWVVFAVVKIMNRLRKGKTSRPKPQQD